MAQPLMAEALKMPQTRQGAKVLPLREEQPRRLQPVTSGTSEPGDALDNMAETLDRGVHAGRALDLRPVARGARRALDWVAHLAFSPGSRRYFNAPKSPYYPFRGAGDEASLASTRCPRTGAFPPRSGRAGPTTSCTRASSFSSNGGTTRQPMWTGSRGNTRT